MDLSKVLAQLRAELENLDAAIANLERIEQGDGRRGRPLIWLSKARPKSRNGSKETQDFDRDDS
jgi:hypothetical protein